MCPESENSLGNPKAIILLSGKRKAGKDYIASLLFQRFGTKDCTIIRLSGPLKERYALENNLDYEKLLDSSDYKELHRAKMIQWGEEIRNKDPAYFCRHAIVQAEARSKGIWVVSDARRKSDIDFFCKHFPEATMTIRINALEEIRKKRGWNFTEGVDDVESECGLDTFDSWDFRIDNNDSHKTLLDVEIIVAAMKQLKNLNSTIST
ncbi:phosphomevalonate kinase-like [Uloborus diversus]|uniref:phosphomevalonate kinase-like n=1 Tax=Uloborus diversus TaxID=327109 RepID=UPI0024091D02|nr:phosphomevalonate kinase-like [Uloborus diversus]